MNTAAEVFDFDAQPKEPEVDACPLCGSALLQRYSSRDRYGFAQPCDRCRDCDLAFLNPRMTREAYTRFYETAYRPLVSAFHGREINAETIQPEQREYAMELAAILEPWTDFKQTLLDVGGSTGVVAKTLADELAFQRVVILDPCFAELRQAVGVEKVYGFVENYDPEGRTFDLVTLCQTADHLLDLSGALKKIRGLLAVGGLFWSDIVDFNVTHEVKIDHPFNLTESTYREFLRLAGFKLRQINYQPDGKHIGFLCEGAA